MAAMVAASCHGARASLSIPGNQSRALQDGCRFFSCGSHRWLRIGCVAIGGQAACGRGLDRRGGGGVAMAMLSAASAVVITASRVAGNADMVRVFGPGVAPLPGFGQLLALDEFFVNPSNVGIPVGEDGALLESLVYYLEEDNGLEGLVEEQPLQSRHGVQLHYFSNMSLSGSIAPVSGGGNAVAPGLSHVRGPSTVPKVLIEEGNDGGAVVKVVSGEFGGLSAPAPLQAFVLLDIVMRPGSAANFPLKPNSGVLIYVLEGVGLFDSAGETVSYQNEGHGLWLSPSYLASAGSAVVQGTLLTGTSSLRNALDSSSGSFTIIKNLLDNLRC